MKTIKTSLDNWYWLYKYKIKMNLKSIDEVIGKMIKLIKYDKLQKDLQEMK